MLCSQAVDARLVARLAAVDALQGAGSKLVTAPGDWVADDAVAEQNTALGDAGLLATPQLTH
jgi:hypothetical protein